MRVFHLVVLSLGLCFGFAACNKKSGGKKGASTTPPPVDEKEDPKDNQTIVAPATTPAPGSSAISGTVCKSTLSNLGSNLGNIGNLNNGNAAQTRQVTIDLSAIKAGGNTGVMQISNGTAVETFNLTVTKSNTLLKELSVASQSGAAGVGNATIIGKVVILTNLPSTTMTSTRPIIVSCNFN